MSVSRQAGLVPSADYDLHYYLREPARDEHRATVVFSHGFSVDGTESHRMFNDIAEAYNQCGVATLQFDYRGCGYSSGSFADFTVSGAINDLVAIVMWLRTNRPNGPLFIHGQSLGSAIAALALAEIPAPAGVVLWNLSANIYERYPRLFGEAILTSDLHCLPEKGLFTGRRFMEDARAFDILAAFENFATPVLFLNAGSDEKSSTDYAVEASRRLQHDNYDLVTIPNANHSFKCQPELQDQATITSVGWVADRLQ